MKQILESLSVILIPVNLNDSFALILWCVFFAVVGALIYMVYNRRRTEKVIRALLSAKAESPESAKTAKELFGNENPLLDKKEERLVASTDDVIPRYYLPSENQKKAQYFLKASSSSLWMTVLGVVGLYAVLLAIYYVLPMILGSFSL